MSDTYHSSSKPWRIFSIIISAIMIVSFIVPINTNTATADVIGIPQPIYPENGIITTPITTPIPNSSPYPPLAIPSFTWSAVTGATMYRLQVDSEPEFNGTILVNITTQNTSFTPKSMSTPLFADGDWYWRVKVEQPKGEWSEVWQFEKKWATEDNKPELLSPVDDPSYPLSFFDYPVFSWNPVIGAAKYRFEIAEDEEFTIISLRKDTLATSYQPNDRLANNTYFWHVIPMDKADHLGTSSDVRSFRLEYGKSVGQIPVLVEPANGSFPKFTPTFQWKPVQGAEYYRLEYTSDQNCDFNVGASLTLVITRQTSYTPINTFPNDFSYCWRVRVESHPVVGDWSEIWTFEKIWDLKPILLTPTHLYQATLYPLYSWTPVPGATSYHIEISKNDFNSIFEQATTTNTTYTPQTRYDGDAHYWWRVTAFDGSGNKGSTSYDEFQSYSTSIAPILVYPLYYYPPNHDGEQYSMNPFEDRTVPYPIFIWHRVMTPAPEGGVYATAYRIQVATTEYFDTDTVWEYDTENTSATPINGDNDFTPLIKDQDYYWRVCVLDPDPPDPLNVNCLDPVSGWSQIWRTRFNPELALTPTTGSIPELLRPAHGQESVEATPLLEWWPFQDITQTQYIVEISRDAGFSSIEISETVNIPAYSPSVSLAQRSLDRIDYGTFYWRVKGFSGGVWSGWSNTCIGCVPWRFQIASQSEWRYDRTLGNPVNQLLIGVDQVGDAADTYDLSTLYATQSGGYIDNDITYPAYWFFGFNANLTNTNTYVIYIDLDHVDESGATAPPERDYIVSTIPAHQPEFAIYVDKTDGDINAQNTRVFAWDGSNWGSGQRLSDIGGFVYTSTGYVELQLLNGAIGMNQTTGSASVMLFSVNSNTGVVEDSVPSDPKVPGSAVLSRFSAVSDRINLISPPNTVPGDPTATPSILPFFWDWPTGSFPSTPFAGSRLEVHLDPNYTNSIANFHINSNTNHFGENNTTLVCDLNDNIYYWRVRARYWSNGHGEAFGAWTGGWSFQRLGFTAQNLQISIPFATPRFRWDMTEGAQFYRLQVSTDHNFSSTVIDQVTRMTSYTPSGTLAPAHYYWRVQVNRLCSVVNDWSDVSEFDLTLLQPAGLRLEPDSPDIPVSYAPTFCWNPPIDENGDPVWIVWKYHVQVSQYMDFNKIYDSIDTVNNCWTPTKGYADGTYYWHVAMVDGNGRMGSYSQSATFIKLYPPPEELYSPINGPFMETPTFSWSPVNGAALYRLEVSLIDTFSTLYDWTETVNTKYTPSKIYASGHMYYWRVAIIDRDGNQAITFNNAQFYIGGIEENRIYLPTVWR